MSVTTRLHTLSWPIVEFYVYDSFVTFFSSIQHGTCTRRFEVIDVVVEGIAHVATLAALVVDGSSGTVVWSNVVHFCTLRGCTLFRSRVITLFVGRLVIFSFTSLCCAGREASEAIDDL